MLQLRLYSFFKNLQNFFLERKYWKPNPIRVPWVSQEASSDIITNKHRPHLSKDKKIQKGKKSFDSTEILHLMVRKKLCNRQSYTY